MSDVQLLLKEAAAPAEQRTLDVERAMRRGNQLRRRARAIRVGSAALAIVAVPLLLLQLPTRGGHNVELVPEERPVFATPSSEPTPSPTPSSVPTTDPDAAVLHLDPVPDSAGADESPALALPGSATSDEAGPGSARAGVAGAPGNPRVTAPRPRHPDPATDPEATEAPSAEDDGTERDAGPPPRAGCVLYGSQAEMGETRTCTFTATHTGGYHAKGMIVPFAYEEEVAPPPEYWSLEIRRGDERVRYTVTNAPGSCMTNVIAPGDVVTASVYRSDPAKDSGHAGYADLFVGDGYGECGDEADGSPGTDADTDQESAVVDRAARRGTALAERERENLPPPTDL